jgi:hypothetical protein
MPFAGYQTILGARANRLGSEAKERAHRGAILKNAAVLNGRSARFANTKIAKATPFQLIGPIDIP